MSPGTSGIFRSGFFLLCCSFTGTRRLKPLRAGKISPWLYMRNPGIVTVWCKSLVANFGLVLGCIEADASKQILILQHCSRSTRFANLCTAQISKFQEKTRPKFCSNEMKFHFIFAKMDEFLQFFCQILTDFYRNFTKNCRKLQIFYRF